MSSILITAVVVVLFGVHTSKVQAFERLFTSHHDRLAIAQARTPRMVTPPTQVKTHHHFKGLILKNGELQRAWLVHTPVRTAEHSMRTTNAQQTIKPPMELRHQQIIIRTDIGVTTLKVGQHYNSTTNHVENFTSVKKRVVRNE